MQYPDEFARAKKAAGARIALYIHLTAYVVVNALLVVINLATSARHLWCMWPLLGWGVGVELNVSRNWPAAMPTAIAAPSHPAGIWRRRPARLAVRPRLYGNVISL